LLAAIGAALIAIEEERLVADDWATDSAAEGIPDQGGAWNLFLPNLRLTQLDLRIIRSISSCTIVKEIVRSENRRPVEPEERSVKLVAPTFCN
jgi:hypothetical protein